LRVTRTRIIKGRALARLCERTVGYGGEQSIIGFTLDDAFAPEIGDASRRRPSHTTGHTGPYHGGSIGLSLSRNIEAPKTEAVEIRVAQGLLDRRMS
jgi:hypothetical protein